MIGQTVSSRQSADPAGRDYPGARDRTWTAIWSPYTSTGTPARPDVIRNLSLIHI